MNLSLSLSLGWLFDAKLYIGWFLVIAYIFWLHFIVFSAFKAAKDAGRKIPTAAYILVAPVLIAGVLMDVTFNIIFGGLMYLENPFTAFTLKSPTTWTLTYRCDRHLTKLAWRGAEARWLCKNLLDPFQSGGHCRALQAAIAAAAAAARVVVVKAAL